MEEEREGELEALESIYSEEFKLINIKDGLQQFEILLDKSKLFNVLTF